MAVETQVLRVAVPPGSQFKGYEPYQVQELEIRARVVRYRRERWLTPDGQTIVAPLPPGTRGHFGPDLRRWVLMQYHQGQVTVERLLAAPVWRSGQTAPNRYADWKRRSRGARGRVPRFAQRRATAPCWPTRASS